MGRSYKGTGQGSYGDLGRDLALSPNGEAARTDAGPLVQTLCRNPNYPFGVPDRKSARPSLWKTSSFPPSVELTMRRPNAWYMFFARV